MLRYPTIGVRPNIIFEGKIDTQTLAAPVDSAGEWTVNFDSDYDSLGNQWPEDLPSTGVGITFVTSGETLTEFVEMDIVDDPLGERGKVFHGKFIKNDPGHAEISRSQYQLTINTATGIKWNCTRGYSSFYMLWPETLPAGTWAIFWEQHEHLASTETYSYYVGLMNNGTTGNVWKYVTVTRPAPFVADDQVDIGPEPELNKWVHFEVEWYKHPTAGYVKSWIDGVQIGDISGKTQEGGDRAFELTMFKVYTNAGGLETWFDNYTVARSRP